MKYNATHKDSQERFFNLIEATKQVKEHKHGEEQLAKALEAIRKDKNIEHIFKTFEDNCSKKDQKLLEEIDKKENLEIQEKQQQHETHNLKMGVKEGAIKVAKGAAFVALLIATPVYMIVVPTVCLSFFLLGVIMEVLCKNF